MHERELEIARRESAARESCEAYFLARPHADNPVQRRHFNAGFERAWDRLTPKHPDGLTDAQIDAIAEGMEGGINGFLAQWGWRQFARAIEAAHGIPPEAKP